MIHAIQFGTFRCGQGFIVLIDGDRVFIRNMFMALVHPCSIVDDRPPVEIFFDSGLCRGGEVLFGDICNGLMGCTVPCGC